MPVARESFRKARETVSVGFGLHHAEAVRSVKGEIFVEMRDGATGELLHKEHRQNVITLDAGILAAMLFRDPASRSLGANMLAVGTGATGALLSPDAPSPLQRKLNNELARKPWASEIFRDAGGNAVAIPTNIVDFTCTFTESEAVGPLNEMSIVATLSANPLITNPNPNNFPTRDTTVDVTLYDILVNYLTFGVLVKPNTASLSITWRITF
jgi:hypothetical protein